MSPKRLLLLLLLATALPAEQSCQGSQQENRRSGPGPEDEPRVILCGRAFVRAVIFSCGGSRWKRVGEQRRSATREPLPDHARAEFVQTSSENGLKSINPQSLWDFKLERLPASVQQSLRDLYNPYDYYNDYVPISDKFNNHPLQIASGVRKRGETRLATSVESYNFPLVKYPQRRSMEIPEMCCKVGCTKEEISALC